MKYTYLFVLSVLTILPGCANLDRSAESGYSKEARRTNLIVRSSKEVDHLRREESRQPISDRTVMKHLENSLKTKEEIQQYSKALPWFKNDEERMEFLRLPGFEARQKWLSEQDFSRRARHVNDSMQDLVEAQDIALGMPMTLVKKSWGEPDSVEVSGNPQFKNERWKYNKYISTPDGYKPEKKLVYFEGGKVVGWEVE